MSGSLGEISALLLILGGVYMLYKKVITWHIPVSVIGTVAVLQPYSGWLNLRTM
jgi:Na+-translocating ferredoxin:NAD+ oxidoreductase subunit D